ncbi:MAG TPA: DUF5305 domain-containing protein [Candidatus Methanoperedenaceae archaeon]|nr:DUF5305 domain-containing protein [Candidatus Methanoperedenaceae archaeon]
MKSLLLFTGILTLLFLSINGAHADSNITAITPVTTNFTDINNDVIFFKIDEKIIAGNNYNVTLNINTSKSGNLSISLQRNDYRLTFFNKTKIRQGSSESVINLTFPEYLDEGMYELDIDLNGVTATKNIFVKKTDNFKDKIVYAILGFLLVGALFLVARYLVFKELYKALFVTILVGGIALNLLLLTIKTIPLLNLPTYVIISSFLGALAYVFISWYSTGDAILEEDKKGESGDIKSIYMKWNSRLIASPIIGIVIYFGASSIFNLTLGNNSDYAIATLCLLSGLYVKPILWRARDTVFSVFAPSEKMKDDLYEFAATPLGKLLGPKMALELRNKFGYGELEEFAMLTDDKLAEIAIGIHSEFDHVKKRREISSLWIQLKSFGKYAASIEDTEKLYYSFNIKTLDDLKSKKSQLVDILEVTEIEKDKLDHWIAF